MASVTPAKARKDKVVATAPDGSSSNDGTPQMRPLHGRTSGPARRSTKGQWTPEEDDILRAAVHRFQGKNWKKIAECFKDRTDVQCLHRWQKVLNPELIKGPWSKEEDDTIIQMVNKYGPKKWSAIAQALPGRIGKQCRERWHNHLNPSINKEAWTQEEELVLIHAHRLVGNKWAELSKFLPGRTDNAIKNHWNSSVKKKINFYEASGLLAQFQGLVHSSNIVLSSLKTEQSNVVAAGSVDRLEGTLDMEEVSECSKDSNTITNLEAEPDMECAILNVMNDPNMRTEPEEGHIPSLRSPEHAMQEVPYMVVPPDQNLLHETETTECINGLLSSTELPALSLFDCFQESPRLFGTSEPCLGRDGVENTESILSRGSLEFLRAAIEEDMRINSENLEQHLATEIECLETTSSEERNQLNFTQENVGKCSSKMKTGVSNNSLHHQSILQRLATMKSSARENDGGWGCLSSKHKIGTEVKRVKDAPLQIRDMEPDSSSYDLFIDVITDGETSKTCQQPKPNETLDTPKLVPVDIFCQSNSESTEKLPTINEKRGQNLKLNESKDGGKPVSQDAFSASDQDSDDRSPQHVQQENSGALFYEPPRFPSLDIPFVSCDLIASSGDPQQDYSPLGIRKLMMSNFSAPCFFLDSPAHADTPDALLRNAAKSFTSTPSIIKKRPRELLSPSEGRKGEKKLERDAVGLFGTSSLASDFSCLDIDDGKRPNSILKTSSKGAHNGEKNVRFSSHGKANLDQDFEGIEENSMHAHSRTSKENVDTSNPGNKSILEANPYGAKQSGALVEHNLNDLLIFSPDQDGHQMIRALNAGNASPRNQYCRILGTASDQGCLTKSSSKLQSGEKNNETQLVATKASEQSPLIDLSEISFENAGDAVDMQSLFGGTPGIKRGIESPSAWKSPWFMSAFLPGFGVGADVTAEDWAYFMSPGLKSYDVISLMRQMNEQTASAFADARDVLAGNDPQESSKTKLPSSQVPLQEENHVTDNEQENIPCNILMERRILDFSECGTPVKGADNKMPSGIESYSSFSSPSSYLMKSCRALTIKN
ncbi:SANT/Myb domain [Dillenia turbinata]|uniref:SANT/Myb domain n=1 Tax=Dillenia turbinata TaxID=194707 RepID=A0AAN8WAW7_9MAGN